MQEIWKDIEEFRGKYQVSNIGRIRSLDRLNIYKKEEANEKDNTNNIMLIF